MFTGTLPKKNVACCLQARQTDKATLIRFMHQQSWAHSLFSETEREVFLVSHDRNEKHLEYGCVYYETSY